MKSISNLKFITVTLLFTGVIAFLVLTLTVTLPRADDDDKKKACTECHKGIVDRFKGELAHEPFGDQDCYACHQFHEFTQQVELKGRIFDICTACHLDVSDGIPEDDLHDPLTDERSCDTCHAPHRSDLENLLVKPAGDLCVDCHDGPADADGNIHKPFGDLKCTVCHDPHGTIFAAHLRLPPGLMCITCHDDILVDYSPLEMHSGNDLKSCENCHAAHFAGASHLLHREGSQLCLSCHKDLVDVADRKHTHDAVVDGECLDCHVPHFPSGGVSLAQPQRELCGGCHDLEDTDFVRAHLGIAPRNCAGCHDPHGSASPKLMRPFVHDPFSERECDSCHGDSVDLRSPVLCGDCHDIEPVGGHAVENVGSRVCVDCHSPHAGRAEFFLR